MIGMTCLGWDARDLDANFTFVDVSNPRGDVAKYAQGWYDDGL